jgi:hypothetical protein
MATVDDFFPGKYLRCADLKGEEAVAVIDHVTDDVFENDGQKVKKPIVHFRGSALKPLVCNKTNFLILATICGPDTNNWPGKKIALYPDTVGFKGKVQDAVRVRRATSSKSEAA